ncbi:hypothetical protein OSB04_010672 [Centaurea solstitialis]|uniref:Protein kinase domain-containing protein n=1 Tax=Centaurea solstitialis TaxID=347529 RepID=A0AA38TST4_9ASTR|nr:hypothetical protein OSB04_010672 [Centaurea solstitialis]
MSLRKWLKQSFVDVNKVERLQIYRQVVQVVDVAHSQGNALQVIELQKNRYACPKKLCGRDLLLANVYSLGILLFELLCSFVSLEMHSAAMSDLRNQILPPSFIFENPQEAGFCLWLLHPQPSSRPTTRDILQFELLSGTKELYFKSNRSSIVGKNEDAEFEILLDFLISLKEKKEMHALELYGNIQFLETNINNIQHKNVLRMFYDSNSMGERIKAFISQLKHAYFSNGSQLQLLDTVSNERNDLDLLGFVDPVGVNEPAMKQKCVGFMDDFLDGVCKFIRYSKFEARGMLKMGNLLNSENVICSLSFDRDENYIAVAGVSSNTSGTSDVPPTKSHLSPSAVSRCFAWLLSAAAAMPLLSADVVVTLLFVTIVHEELARRDIASTGGCRQNFR